MKYEQQVFDRLSKGVFIYSDSVDETTRRVFLDLDNCRDEYADYFSRIGFILEEGNQYYYFSRKESKSSIADKLKKFSHWIDVIDFLKAWEPSLGPGFTFMTADLVVKIDSDIELRDKASTLYDNKSRHDEIAERLVEDLSKQGFIEITDDVARRYKVTPAYRYLEDMVNLIAFNDDDEITD